MKKVSNLLAILFGSLIAFGIFWLVYIGFSSLGGATDTVKVAVIGGFISIVTIVLSRFFEQRREYRQRINLEKVEIYNKLINLIFDVLSPEHIRSGKFDDESVLAKEMVDIQR